MNGKHLLYILYIYCRNWLKVIIMPGANFSTAGCNTSWKQIPHIRLLKLNLEYQNIKMGRETYEYLFFNQHLLIEYHSYFCSCSIFWKSSYYNSYASSKNIILTVKVIHSGMYNCIFEAINLVLNKRKKKLEMEYESYIYTIIIYLMLWIRFRKKLVMLRLGHSFLILCSSSEACMLLFNTNFSTCKLIIDWK